MAGSRERHGGARRAAWDVLWRTQRGGAFADLALADLLARPGELREPDRGLVHELVMGTLRWQGCLDRALARTAERPLSRIPARLLIALRLGAYQLLYLDRVPPSAAVNETVELAKALGYGHAAGFVNAVLRAVQRKGRELLGVDPSLAPADRLAQETSHPPWMAEQWIRQWGEAEAWALCRANNRIPPVTLRTNTLRISREELSEVLRRQGVHTQAAPFSPEALKVVRLPGPLASLESFVQGDFHVQDEASQLMAHWLWPRPGERILDACAAPGGKATHLAQLMEGRGRIVAVDSHGARLGLVRRACSRLGVVGVETVQADLTDPRAVPRGPWDRILLDAPCSGLGVLRRHPDAKWRRDDRDPGRLAGIQRALLRALIPELRPGGTLLYSVCTHTPEETEGVLEAVLREVPGIRLLAAPDGLPPPARDLLGPDGLLRTFPHRHDMDGFTAFRLERVR
jgi:16S rRNA (cytosine967-C5)-methyltransferase